MRILDLSSAFNDDDASLDTAMMELSNKSRNLTRSDDERISSWHGMQKDVWADGSSSAGFCQASLFAAAAYEHQ
jgi:hypothetical protein